MPEKIDPATLELIERIDIYCEGMDESEPDAESANALVESLAALCLKLDLLAARRDPAGDSPAGAAAADHEGHPPTWPGYIDDRRQDPNEEMFERQINRDWRYDDQMVGESPLDR